MCKIKSLGFHASSGFISAKGHKTGCNRILGVQIGMILLEVNTHFTSYRIQGYNYVP